MEQCLVDSEASPIEIATALATMQFDGRPFLLEPDPYESDRRGRGRRDDFGDSRRSNTDDDRGPRRSRGSRDRAPLEVSGDFLEMFRVEVGRAHGVKPGNLWGPLQTKLVSIQAGLDKLRFTTSLVRFISLLVCHATYSKCWDVLGSSVGNSEFPSGRIIQVRVMIHVVTHRTIEISGHGRGKNVLNDEVADSAARSQALNLVICRTTDF